MNACPSCGGTSGVRFVAIERQVYVQTWDNPDEPECTNSEGEVRRDPPRCIDCGLWLSWRLLRAKP